MSATVALQADRLLFSSTSDMDVEGADMNCAIVASTDTLTFSGANGTTGVRLTGVAPPTAASDAVSAGSLSWKAPVIIAVTTPLSGATYVDGVLQGPTDPPGPLGEEQVGHRILVTGQVSAVENGIYVVTVAGEEPDGENPGTAYEMVRAHDFADGCTLSGAAVFVRAGWEAGKIYAVSSNGDIAVGVDDISFTVVGGGAPGAEGPQGPEGPPGLPGNDAYLAARAVDLEHMAYGSGRGQLLVYDTAFGDPLEGYTPARLDMGTEHYPLVAGGVGYLPQYAQLTTAGIANGAVTGAQLAGALYQESIIIGNVEGSGEVGESIRFGASDADGAAVGIYVHNSVKLSATETGGAFSGTWSGSSDEKWKHLLGPISEDPLADLDKVEAQSWTWKGGYHFTEGVYGAGVVAQQFQLVCPSAVTYSVDQDGLVVDYNAVQSFTLSCTKALKQESNACKAEIAALQQEHTNVQVRMSSFEQDITPFRQDIGDLKARLALLEAAFHSHAHP